MDAGHFWAQFSDIRNARRLSDLMKKISCRNLVPFVMAPDKMVGKYCLAQYSGDGMFYRAKILRTDIQKRHQQVEVSMISGK